VEALVGRLNIQALRLHRDLLRYSEKDERHRGEYKTLRNDVAAFDAGGKMIGIVFETATPLDTPRRMAELLARLKDARTAKTQHPLLIVAVFTVVFLAIHPFRDGNGRLSRILTTLLLLQAGYAHVPYSSLESVIENSKEAYYVAMRQMQSTLNNNTADWQPWLLFFLRALQQRKRRLAAKVEREIAAIKLTDLAVKILDYARAHGRVSTRDMVREYGASANTAQARIHSSQHSGACLKSVCSCVTGEGVRPGTHCCSAAEPLRHLSPPLGKTGKNPVVT
jgi:Fic family protein